MLRLPVVLFALAAVVPAVEITQPPTSAVVSLDQPLRLTCTAKGAKSYQWFKDGAPVPGATGPALAFPQARLSASGSYAVVAADGAEATISPAAQVLVLPERNRPVLLALDLGSEPTATVPDRGAQLGATLIKTPLPVLATGPGGSLAKAWDFSGSSAAIVVKAQPALERLGDVNRSTGLTLAFWILGSKGPANRRIVKFGQTLEITNHGKGDHLQIYLGDDANMARVELHSPKEVFDGGWHHVAVVADFLGRKDNVRLLIDGKVTSSLSLALTRSFASSKADFKLAGNATDLILKLAGVVLADRALEPAEVEQVREQGLVTAVAPQVLAAADREVVVPPEERGVNLLGGILPGGSTRPTCRWSKVSGPGEVTFASATTPSTRATFSTVGTYLLRLTAQEGALTTSREVTVAYRPNQVPTAFASAAPTAISILPGQVVLNGGGLDDGLPLNPGRLVYRWQQVSGPATAALATPTTWRTSVALPASSPGSYVFRLTASDGPLSSTADVTVAVVANQAPVVQAVCQRPIRDPVLGGTPFVLSAVTTDDGMPSSRRLTHAWSLVSGPGPLAFDQPSAASCTATAKEPGIYQVRVAVSDGSLTTTADQWLKITSPAISKIVRAPTAVTVLSPTPPPFEHPRIFFTKADRPELQRKAAEDPLVQQAITHLRHIVTTRLEDPKSPVGAVFAALQAGNQDVDIRPFVEDAWALRDTEGLYGLLASAAYVAWLDGSDGPRQRQLAAALAVAARSHARWYQGSMRAQKPGKGGLGGGVSADLGLCYDLLYDAMTEDERRSVRTLLADMGINKRTIMWNSRDIDISTNWRNAHHHVLIAQLAIEGEPGADPDSIAANIQAIKIFDSKWGISEDGFNREGSGYFAMGQHAGSLAVYAASRRGENLLVTTHFYQGLIENFYGISADPVGIRTYGDAGGFHVSGFYDVQKGAYPSDPMTDFIYRKALQTKRYDTAMPLIRAIFGRSPLPGDLSQGEVATAKAMSIDVHSPQRGLSFLRSDWGDDALRLDFDCRFDTCFTGHLHSDRNAFYLYALQRPWFTESGYHGVDNDAHSTITIDGVGQAGSSAKPKWPSLPGRYLEAISTPLVAIQSGDAKNAYDHSWGPKNYAYDNLNNGTPTKYRWVDFMPPGWDPPVAINGDNTWATQFINADPDLYNAVQRAFRTVALARGPQPYALVLDDLQKDDLPHDYAWVANTSLGDGDMQVKPGATASEAVLFRAPDDGAGKPRLLMRTIEAKGAGSPITIDTALEHTRRLCIARRQVVAPDFKVLLYPHREGEPVPASRLDGDRLTITLPDGTRDTWTLVKTAEGRTRVAAFVRGGGSPPTIRVPDVAPVVADATSSTGLPAARVTFTVTAVDAEGKPVTVTTRPASGSLLRVGTIPVTAVATDAAGRVATTVFQVQVRAP